MLFRVERVDNFFAHVENLALESEYESSLRVGLSELLGCGSEICRLIINSEFRQAMCLQASSVFVLAYSIQSPDVINVRGE